MKTLLLILFLFVLIFSYNFYKSYREKLPNNSNLNDTASIETLISKPEKGTEDKFLIAMLLADDIDSPTKTRKTKTAIKSLTDAMNNIANRPPSSNDEFMINRAEDIFVTNFEDIQNNLDNVDFQQAIQFDIAINNAKSKPDNRKLQIQQANTRQEARNIAFANTVTSDAQNTHERGVLNDTKKVINNLKKSTTKIPISQCMTEARERCKHLEPSKRRKAEATLSKIDDGFISGLNDTESDIFALVWSRSHHEANENNKEEIQNAILDALVDSVNNDQYNTTVCVTGRAARYVGALAILDFDDKSTKVMTYEMHKNEIFNDCKSIIENEIKSLSVDPTSVLAQGAKSYENADSSNVTAEEVFKKHVRDKIVEKIATNDGLSVDDRAKITQSCLEYVDLV